MPDVTALKHDSELLESISYLEFSLNVFCSTVGFQ